MDPTCLQKLYGETLKRNKRVMLRESFNILGDLGELEYEMIDRKHPSHDRFKRELEVFETLWGQIQQCFAQLSDICNQAVGDWEMVPV